MRIAIVAAAAATALLAACGSSTSTEATSSSVVAATPAASAAASVAATPAATPAPASVAASAASIPAPSPVDTSTLSCTDFVMAAAHLTTYYHYAALAVNTNNQTDFARINDTLALMNAMAPQCAPDGVDALAAFMPAAAAFQQAYVTGTDPSAVKADTAALAALQPEGEKLYKALGISPDGWSGLATGPG